MKQKDSKIAFGSIPEDLKEFKHFTNWKSSSKVPLNPNNPKNESKLKNAKPNDPSTWGDFDTACRNVNEDLASGIGFCLSEEDPFVFVDLDHCLRDGSNLTDLAKSVVEFFRGKTYIERSRSGDGIHIIARSKIPAWLVGKLSGKNLGTFEIYHSKKVIALTGNIFEGNSRIGDVDEKDLDDLLRKLFPDRYKRAIKSRQIENRNVQTASVDSAYMDFAIAWACDKWNIFDRAFHGDASNWIKDDGDFDKSRRDKHVIGVLLQITGGDLVESERAFRNSKCILDVERKGNKKTQEEYIQRTMRECFQDWNSDLNFHGERFDYTRAIRKAMRSHNENSQEEKSREMVTASDSAAVTSFDSDMELFRDYRNSEACDGDLLRLDLTQRGRKLLFVSDTIRGKAENHYYIWNKDFGKFDETNHSILLSKAKKLGERFSAVAGKIDKTNPVLSDKLSKGSRRLETTRGQSNAVIQAFIDSNDSIRCSQKNLDMQSLLFNFANGVLVLDPASKNFLKLLPHDPRYLFTLGSPVAYDPHASNPLWDKTIKAIIPDPALRHEFQKFIGYSLSGNPNQHKFAVLYGYGRNGKSILRNAIQSVFGDFSTDTSFSVFSQRSEDLEKSSDVSPLEFSLRNLRLVTISEIPTNGVFSASKLKRYHGNDKITARDLFSEPTTFDPQFRLMIVTNDLPRFSSMADPALAERLFAFLLNQSFAENPDTDLGEKLQHPEVQRAIAKWIVDGYRMFVAEKFQPTSEMLILQSQMLDIEDNFIMEFIEQCCERNPEASISQKELKKAIRAWNSAEIQSLKDRDIIEQFDKYITLRKDLGISKYRRGDGMRYKGIQIDARKAPEHVTNAFSNSIHHENEKSSSNPDAESNEHNESNN